MTISIITITFNSSKTLRRCMDSVLEQKEVSLEYIIIDGNSDDGTKEIIEDYAHKYSCIRWVSEPDKGIYDAMNKGLKIATGDIVGILNSDDMYTSNDVLKSVVDTFENNAVDSCFGNILYIKNQKPYRYWRSGKVESFKSGWMPPHPVFFLRREVYEKYGFFRLDCGTAADYELMLRLFEKEHITSKWINKLFVYMEAGGASGANLNTYKKAHSYDKDAWKLNNLNRPFYTIWLKKIRKLPQFLLAKFIRVDL